jgi:protein TonB
VEQLLIQATSGHEILDRAALAAVKDWLFEPGQRGGRRVAMKVLVPVRFSLR